MSVHFFLLELKKSTKVCHFLIFIQCVDVYMVDDDDAKSEDHPAMCARNNDTLIPMPDEL